MIDLTDGYHYAIVFDKERIIEKKKDLPIPYCKGFCCQNYQYLTPVPSYEEWQASYNCMLENEVLRLKNTKLKELLKGAKEIIEWYKDDCGSKDIETEAMLQHINQALGEDK